jgi:hypothetical protein
MEAKVVLAGKLARLPDGQLVRIEEVHIQTATLLLAVLSVRGRARLWSVRSVAVSLNPVER